MREGWKLFLQLTLVGRIAFALVAIAGLTLVVLTMWFTPPPPPTEPALAGSVIGVFTAGALAVVVGLDVAFQGLREAVRKRFAKLS